MLISKKWSVHTCIFYSTGYNKETCSPDVYADWNVATEYNGKYSNA